MLINEGEKFHIITRRVFEADTRRHFIGQVVSASGSVVRLRGKIVIFDAINGEYVQKPELRDTIMDLAESGYIVNTIPPEIGLDDLRYTTNKGGKLILTDEKGFSLYINEFGINR